MDIPTRSADKPFVVGRGNTADLQLPSIKLLATHAVLFVQGDQWAIADRSKGAVRVNGTAISAPTLLRVGDLITLVQEEKPTTLLIEPARAAGGQKGSPARDTPTNIADRPPASTPMASPVATPIAPSQATPVASPVVPTDGTARPMPTLSSPPPPIRRAAPPPPMSVATRQGIASMPGSIPAARSVAPRVPSSSESDDPDMIDLGMQSDFQPTTTLRRRPAKPATSGIAVAVGVLIALAIAGGTAYVVYRQLHQPVQIVMVGPVKPTTAGPSTAPAPKRQEPVFTTTLPATPMPASQAPVEDTATTPSPADENPAVDPHAGDLDWTDVQVAHDMTNQAAALLRYDDYRRRNPGKNTDELKKLEQETMDRMWWQRISELWQARGRAKASLEKKGREIAEEGEAAFKAKLIEEKGLLEQNLAQTEQALQVDMGYKAEVLPNLTDEQSMTAARAARDKNLYTTWARATAQYIRLHGGRTPWEDAQ